MRLSSYLASAAAIITLYDGLVPFAAWLKNHFKQHKKFGSRDRKQIADLCFCYFRLGNAFRQQSTEERLLIGQFLCHNASPFVTELKPEWKEHSHLPVKEKWSFLSAADAQSIFPFTDAISTAIEKEKFELSLLQQPHLFLRIRPGKEEIVSQKLEHAGIAFTQTGDCLRFANGTKLDEIISLDEEAVVQDVGSQKVLQPLQKMLLVNRFMAWDCCAASGGKTILLHDRYPKANLTVSDIRESIIINLRNRLKRAGINQYRSFVADVLSPAFSLPQKFDVIICDAPCSGSGTWGRTPDQLVFFKKEKIEHYSSLQKNIASRASIQLNAGGFFLYITCSVFRAENEEVVAYLQQATSLQLLSQEYFKGYDAGGDTLFTALFTV